MNNDLVPPVISIPLEPESISPIKPDYQPSILAKIWRVFYLSIITLGIISLSYYLLLNPMRARGENLPEVFKVDSYIFSERISFLLREPRAGDAVIFKTPEKNHFGIIVSIKDISNIKTYQVISTTSQQTPWEITRDKILSRIYFPSVRGLDLSMTPLSSPAPLATSDPTAGWQTYNNEKYQFSISYPPNFFVKETEPAGYREFGVTISNKNTKESLRIEVVGNTKVNYDEISKSYHKNDTSWANNPSIQYTENLKTTLANLGAKTFKSIVSSQIGGTNSVETTYYFVDSKNSNFILIYHRPIVDNLAQVDLLSSDQILSTFKFTDNPSTNQKASFSGSLQDYLKINCKPGNPYTIEVSKLPIKIDSKLITPTARPDGITAYCSSTGPDSLKETSVSIHLNDNDILNLYDQASIELGHGGAPFLGLFGEEVYHQEGVRITAYPNYGEGPALLGTLGINLRGQKEYINKSGDTYYVNITTVAIPGDDPRLISYFKPYSYDDGFDAPAIDSGKINNSDLIRHFFDSVQPNTREYISLAKLKDILNSVLPR